MSGRIVIREEGGLPERVMKILSNMDGLEEVLRANAFDQEELVQIIISHIRDVDPKVSQAGIKTFFDYTDRLARNNGLMVTASQERTDANGNVTRVSTQRLAHYRDRAPGHDATSLGSHLHRPATNGRPSFPAENGSPPAVAPDVDD